MQALIIGFASALGRLPLRILFGLSSALAPILIYLLPYRRAVIDANLARVFPDRSDSERKAIRNEFYRRLLDFGAEMLCLQHLPEHRLKQRLSLKADPRLKAFAEAGQPVMVLGSHFLNLEFAGQAFRLEHPEIPLTAFFKPLHLPAGQAISHRARTRFGVQLVPAMRGLHYMRDKVHGAHIVISIADQAPHRKKRKLWVDWLGTPTAFQLGPEQIARRLGWPVFCTNLRRVRRGHYELEIAFIAEPPYANATGTDITEAYARHCAASVLQDPPAYLWSHRRWRHEAGDEALAALAEGRPFMEVPSLERVAK